MLFLNNEVPGTVRVVHSWTIYCPSCATYALQGTWTCSLFREFLAVHTELVFLFLPQY